MVAQRLIVVTDLRMSMIHKLKRILVNSHGEHINLLEMVEK